MSSLKAASKPTGREKSQNRMTDGIGIVAFDTWTRENSGRKVHLVEADGTELIGVLTGPKIGSLARVGWHDVIASSTYSIDVVG